uniref:DUF4350 domain-containing protein n=1 Tax=Trichocoleus desertorum TaxID=1481672 RepID=UPI0025B328D7|nr:DUF4350 domain-containing protein [Trichocoleus desertorum]
MNPAQNLSRRQMWFGLLIVGAIALLTLLAAPTQNVSRSGSTYSRTPDGYGAWYSFMAGRGTPIQRWQQPFEQLVQKQPDSKTSSQLGSQSGPQSSPEDQGKITLLQINSGLRGASLDDSQKAWVEAGNTLLLLGVHAPVTEATFRTLQTSESGDVRVETRRRHYLPKKDTTSLKLGDRFGAVVWQESLGQGRVIWATTPHLAANVYQDHRANYEFLAQLVTESKQPIWVDEYLHGYRDPSKATATAPEKRSRSLLAYLANTALLPGFIQVVILLLLGIWAHNRRFGQPISVTAPTVDNSKAYIEALAGVLHKAESSEFVIDTIRKEEQLQVQRALGLGNQLLDSEILLTAWTQQTGRPAAELADMLQLRSRGQRVSDRDLLVWLEKIQTVRHHLPRY